MRGKAVKAAVESPSTKASVGASTMPVVPVCAPRQQLLLREGAGEQAEAVEEKKEPKARGKEVMAAALSRRALAPGCVRCRLACELPPVSRPPG